MSRFEKIPTQLVALPWRSVAARGCLSCCSRQLSGRLARAARAEDELPVQPTRRFGPFQPQPDTVIWKSPDGHNVGPKRWPAAACRRPIYLRRGSFGVGAGILDMDMASGTAGDRAIAWAGAILGAAGATAGFQGIRTSGPMADILGRIPLSLPAAGRGRISAAAARARFAAQERRLKIRSRKPPSCQFGRGHQLLAQFD